MPIYVIAKAKLRSWDMEDDEPFRPHLDVDGHEPCDTGLICVTGEPIMRLPNPIGFGRDDEW